MGFEELPKKEGWSVWREFDNYVKIGGIGLALATFYRTFSNPLLEQFSFQNWVDAFLCSREEEALLKWAERCAETEEQEEAVSKLRKEFDEARKRDFAKNEPSKESF